MSTVEMLGIEKRANEVDHFADWLSDNGSPLSTEARDFVSKAAGETIYGHIIGSNLEYWRETGVDPELAAQAAVLLSTVTLHSSEMYTRDKQGVRSNRAYGIYSDEEFWEALAKTQGHIAEGDISEATWLPDKYAMTCAEGKSQVETADHVLSTYDDGAGRLLSDSNYSLYFKDTVMANGAELPNISINEIVEAQDRGKKLINLSMANYGIGQMLQHISAGRQGSLDIVEIGPGTGATSAAVLAGLNEAGDFNSVTLRGYEPNADFIKILQDFVGKIEQSQLGSHVKPEYLHQSAVEGFEDLSFLPQADKDIAVFVAGHALHRLTTQQKISMVHSASKSSPNSAFLVGDLKRNGSPVNRRDLNFAQNGPLNAGNLTLNSIFQAQGYSVYQLTSANAPDTVNLDLARAIEGAVVNDGHFWVAYKGVEAARLLTPRPR